MSKRCEVWPKEYANRIPGDTSKLPKGVCWFCTVMKLPGDHKHPMHRCKYVLGKEVVPKQGPSHVCHVVGMTSADRSLNAASTQTIQEPVGYPSGDIVRCVPSSVLVSTTS